MSWFPRLSKNDRITASIGQMGDERFIVHPIEVVILGRDLAVHCRRSII